MPPATLISDDLPTARRGALRTTATRSSARTRRPQSHPSIALLSRRTATNRRAEDTGGAPEIGGIDPVFVDDRRRGLSRTAFVTAQSTRPPKRSSFARQGIAIT